MASVVDEAEPILTGSGRRLQDIDPLLHESWRMKRGIADRISNEHIDAIYETGLMAGALGGKLHRTLIHVMFTSRAMRRAPVAAKQFHRALV